MQFLEMKLIPSSGGCFELTANGKLLYSKLSEGKFPNEELILKQLEVLMDEFKKGEACLVFLAGRKD